MKINARYAQVLCAFLVFFGTSACEITNPADDLGLLIDIEDAEIDFGSNGIAVSVRPGEPSATSTTVSNDFDVEAVEELRRIRLKPEFFAFNPSASKSSDIAATGTVEVSVFIAGWPLPSTPVTVTVDNNVVTAVTPNQISFAGATYSLDEASLEALLAALGSNAPDLEDWQGASMNEVIAALNAAFAANSFPVTVAVNVTDSDDDDALTGELVLSTISIDAQIAR